MCSLEATFVWRMVLLTSIQAWRTYRLISGICNYQWMVEDIRKIEGNNEGDIACKCLYESPCHKAASSGACRHPLISETLKFPLSRGTGYVQPLEPFRRMLYLILTKQVIITVLRIMGGEQTTRHEVEYSKSRRRWGGLGTANVFCNTL